MHVSCHQIYYKHNLAPFASVSATAVISHFPHLATADDNIIVLAGAYFIHPRGRKIWSKIILLVNPTSALHMERIHREPTREEHRSNITAKTISASINYNSNFQKARYFEKIARCYELNWAKFHRSAQGVRKKHNFARIQKKIISL